MVSTAARKPTLTCHAYSQRTLRLFVDFVAKSTSVSFQPDEQDFIDSGSPLSTGKSSNGIVVTSQESQ